MKVLTIGSDRKLFDATSAVYARNVLYSSRMEELVIIVFTLSTQGFKEIHDKNLHIYPTHSSFRYAYVWDAYNLGKKVIIEHKFVRGDAVLSTQDPFEAGLVGYWLKNAFRLPLQLACGVEAEERAGR